ncbi:hypothetical protein SAMN02799622_00787 [Methylobacterium sp. UNC378MF]|uniref:hypothetical protein n=1 Tax=Methylobacterium sp. UNC378MF TaxID=1502748 RepID=UPI000890F6B2|nr:hypothetical protein [Methylobacterium sp. UNC378MF]SDA12712.1 hypothetical protein SAMN02799622_00787 [Methylobacterium sp. UNC378MF]
MAAPDELEMTLLGLAVYQSQRLEFALYGLAAHLSHLPEAQKEKRFRDLTPEKFLRGDYRELKSTLGQIAKVFGGPLMLASDDLERLIEDRNLICHNLYRLYHAGGARSGERPHEFLMSFNQRAEQWGRIIGGVLSHLREAFARKEGRLDEFNMSEDDAINRAVFHEHVRQVLEANSRQTP